MKKMENLTIRGTKTTSAHFNKSILVVSMVWVWPVARRQSSREGLAWEAATPNVSIGRVEKNSHYLHIGDKLINPIVVGVYIPMK